jgi:peptidoglycan/xylan/chitin deacetylase (PgdA/CDA1 family)
LIETAKRWAKGQFDWLLTGIGVLIYHVGLGQQLIQLNRRTAKVLMYHACEDQESDFTRGLSINTTPSQFSSHLEFLARHYRVTSLAGLTEGVIAEPTVVITFDDGFRSVYENAWPRLHERGFCAVCYLTTDVIGNTQLIWLNELNWFFHCHAAVARPIVFEFLRVDSSCPAAVVMRLLVDRYDPELISALIARLRAAVGVDAEELARNARVYLDWNEIEEMSSAGITFGNHTGSHPPLAALSAETCREEISRAAKVIARLPGGTPTLAYPFGTTDETTRQIALELGNRCLLEVHGVNSPFDPTRIGRIKMGPFSAAVLFARMEVVEPVKTWLKRRLRPARPEGKFKNA